MKIRMYVELKDIKKTIHKSVILEDINLRFEGGKVYGFKGKNGCGKTMLMRVICGLIRPDEGIVDINGDILWKDISFPKSVGTLIENPAFLGGYTGLKNLEILAGIKGQTDIETIREALEKVGLNPDDKRKYRKYSLGMKQRLGIACAFMEHPDLVILDEPINALDEQGVVLVRRILDELKNEGKIIIIACHDADEMNLLADEIIYLESGRIKKVKD